MVGKYKTVAGLLADRKRWCKGEMARLGNNSPCYDYTDFTKAAKFCLLGAIAFVCGDDVKLVDEKQKKLLSVIGVAQIADWNDSPKRTHGEVLRAVKKAKI